MFVSLKRTSILVLAIVPIVLAASLVMADARYTITDLGTISGGESYAYGVNDSGQVVGVSSLPGNTSDSEPFLWDITNGMQSLGPQREGLARGINNSGQVVGHFQFDDLSFGAFIWDTTNGYQKLCEGGVGYGINNSGHVAINKGSRAFLWDITNGLQNIGTLGGNYSYTSGINDAGKIVGYSNLTTGSYDYHGFIWDDTNGCQDLGTLGPYGSRAYGINNLGHVVGESYTPSGSKHAFIWEDGLMTDIGIGRAYAINDSRQVVGEFGLWENGVVTAVGDLLPENSDWSALQVNNINNNGQIVGYGINPDGETHAFLMTPIPEPVIEAALEIVPRTLNLRSKGKWIVCRISLPEDYSVADIDPNNILLEDEIEAERVWLLRRFAVAKFSRPALQDLLADIDTPATVDLLVSGQLNDDTPFEGTDTIKLIDRKKKPPHPVILRRKTQPLTKGAKK